MSAVVYRVDVRITAPVKDTEVTDRVADAIHNLFPNATIEERPGTLVAETHTLDRFSELLHRRAILDTARSELFGGRNGTDLSFSLKKQAAFQGVVNFSVGRPSELGELDVEIRVSEPDVEAFIDFIAPPTEDGKPITGDR